MSGVQAGKGATASGIPNLGTKAKCRSAFHIFYFVHTERAPSAQVILGCDGPQNLFKRSEAINKLLPPAENQNNVSLTPTS
jgi:hypothetical protein